MSDRVLLFRGRRPAELRFGTSGLRGRVTDITDLEAYINTRGFLDYLSRLGEIRAGDAVAMAGDLRPSTDGPQRSILKAVARGVEDAGLAVDYLGKIPTPALTYYGLLKDQASIMVTGSHIPFDRNGIKFNTTRGEVLKNDEPGILEAVAAVRQREYERPRRSSLFGDDGMFKKGVARPLPAVNEEGRRRYIERYLDFFPSQALAGKRVVVFEHSAVGREILVELLEALGAEVHRLGRSEQFIAIDTEDIHRERLQQMQALVDAVSAGGRPPHALVSTDGDSDRPLLVGVDSKGRARFYGGDLLGILVAEYVCADAVAVPVSANDAVDLHLAKAGVLVRKTRIGSPWVIEAMEALHSEAKVRRVVGWEANGGFLTGSAIEKDGRRLAALPTRDAALPLLSILSAMAQQGVSAAELFSRLPLRYSKAGLIDDFAQDRGRALVRCFSPNDPNVTQVDFEAERVVLHLADGRSEPASAPAAAQLRAIKEELEGYFSPEAGFGELRRVNVIDGVRMYFANGDIAHIRPSGNAPQLRLYAVADTEERAEAIVDMGVREPDGILRRIESARFSS